MNYQVHYDRLIAKACSRAKLEGYTEQHHIVPLSLGGSTEQSNLITLTAREHFVAHLLLFKSNPNHKGLAYAAYRMSHRHLYKSSRIYSSLRETHVEACKEIGTNHKLRGTGIFAKGMQSKGGTVSSQLAISNKLGIHSEKYYGVGGKVSGKLPWWFNPVSGKSRRAKESPGEEWIRGRGNTIRASYETQSKLKIGIYAEGVQLKAARLGGLAKKKFKL